MKAIVYEEFGGSEVMAVAVNSSDHRIRRGRLQPCSPGAGGKSPASRKLHRPSGMSFIRRLLPGGHAGFPRPAIDRR